MPQRYHKAPRRLPPPLIPSVGYFLTNTCIFWNAWKDIYNFRWCWESVEVSERQFKEENNPRCIAQRDCTLLTDWESIAASLLQPDGTRTSQLSMKPPPWKPFFLSKHITSWLTCVHATWFFFIFFFLSYTVVCLAEEDHAVSVLILLLIWWSHPQST